MASNTVKTMQSPKVKYRALRMIAFFYRVVAYLVILIIIVTLFMGARAIFFPSLFTTVDPNDPAPAFVLPLAFLYKDLLAIIASYIFGTIFAISLFAISEGISIYIDIANDLSKIKAEVTHNSD